MISRGTIGFWTRNQVSHESLLCILYERGSCVEQHQSYELPMHVISSTWTDQLTEQPSITSSRLLKSLLMIISRLMRSSSLRYRLIMMLEVGKPNPDHSWDTPIKITTSNKIHPFISLIEWFITPWATPLWIHRRRPGSSLNSNRQPWGVEVCRSIDSPMAPGKHNFLFVCGVWKYKGDMTALPSFCKANVETRVRTDQGRHLHQPLKYPFGVCSNFSNQVSPNWFEISQRKQS